MKANEVMTFQCICGISESRPESNGRSLRYSGSSVRLQEWATVQKQVCDLKTAIKYCYNNIDPDTFETMSGSMNRRRKQKCYIAQVVHEFLKDPTDGQKIIALWLNYRTEPILTAKELKAPYRRILTQSEIADLCNFYFEAIGRDLAPLKRPCQSKIVNVLGEKGDLRNGISQLPLPPKIQSYLLLGAQPCSFTSKISTNESK
ncbi:hypothetical protein AVEN_136128-1 [Araneus ventricosus]|uniref:SOCS box domain-containing protein n=1 Tax=Araneus ventricosus TaxID=182803 RepID=A0A4Y2V5K2_ARAVE|nr:hypothetical protein AVEN_95012-1 [Araneus ventricosus]GBO19179.1 hypothetical protein AVEN_136128-1 [Araneus ventricosus]